MQLLFCFSFGLFICMFVGASAGGEGCISGASRFYSGEQSVTASGSECQRWDANTPHAAMFMPSDGGHHNFCRNPEGDIRGPWCYTVDPIMRYGFCGIPKCPSDAIIFWNAVNVSTDQSYFSQVDADPEFMSQLRGGPDYSQYAKESDLREDSRLKALSADHEQQVLYFTDTRSNYFGVYDVKTQKTQKHLHGIVEHIEAISYDWLTKNLYWSDSRLKVIMVSDFTFKSYAPIYKPADGYTPYALEVNSVKRLIIFSTYTETPEMGAKIISTDLSGRNENVLFEYPEISKVVGLTVDCVEDRIYWVESFETCGSGVVSSRTDGTDKVRHYVNDRASYYDITVYFDYIYVSDTLPRKNLLGELWYHIQILGKQSEKRSHYRVSELPMGIATYAFNKLHATTKPQGPGECLKPCDGLCLPTLVGERRCACSVGYVLNPYTSECSIEPLVDDYLLVVDAKEGRVYQISLNSDERFSAVSLDNVTRITCAAADPSSRFVYFSDVNSESLRRAVMQENGSLAQVADSYAQYIEIDPLTGNIFFTDGKSITVSAPDGNAEKVIVESKDESDIKAFAIDFQNKYLYWTDTFSAENAGKLMRCRFDGSKRQVILEQLNGPCGVTIDFTVGNLYMVESKTGQLHVLPLNKLKSLKSKYLKNRKYKQHNLGKALKPESNMLTECSIKVFGNTAYVIDESQTQLLKFDLSGDESTTPIHFGPGTFYKAACLSVYSKSMNAEVTSGVESPCEDLMKDTSCELCVDMNRKKAKCLVK